jgi:hypothetical protein
MASAQPSAIGLVISWRQGFPRDVVELALAHTVGDATERAYRRGTALEHRRELMKAWAAYCDRPPEADNIIPMERIKPIPA